MSTSEIPPPGPRGRVWFPKVVLGLALLIEAIVWFVPLEQLDFGLRLVITFNVAAIVAALLVVWTLFFSPFSRDGRFAFGTLVAVLGAAFAFSIRRVEFTGDMIPHVDFRWTESREERLAEFRAQRGLADPVEQGAEPVTTTKRPVAADLAAIGPGDAPEFRGPKRDGIYRGPGNLNLASPRRLWKQPIGGGYAAFSVIGNVAVTIEQRREREAVVAYEARTGEELWVHSYPALFSEQLGGDGPRATPTIADGKVFSLGATGHLVCLDGKSGEPLWAVDILEANQVKNLDWGMSGSPLVFDGKVVVQPGTRDGSAQSRAVWALDVRSGEPRWKAGAHGASYASPMLATLSGKRQILIFDADGVAGLDPDGGAELWRYEWKSQFEINAAQPVIVDGDRLLVTSQTGAALLKLTESGGTFKAEELWTNTQLKGNYASPILWDGSLYGLDMGMLACLDLESGKRRWKKGRYGHGQLLLAGGTLVILSEKGELAFVAARPDQFDEQFLQPLLEGKTWNTPTLANGLLLIRNHLEAAAYDLGAGAKPASP